MKGIPLSLLLILSFAVCASAANSKPIPADTVITLDTGACEKRCAVFKLVVLGDGTVLYDGQYYVRIAGLKKTKIDANDVGKLIEAFNAIDYFSLKDSYRSGDADCQSPDSDGAIVKTSLAYGGRSKSIVHDTRCHGAVPQKLTELENKLGRLSGIERWIR